MTVYSIEVALAAPSVADVITGYVSLVANPCSGFAYHCHSNTAVLVQNNTHYGNYIANKDCCILKATTVALPQGVYRTLPIVLRNGAIDIKFTLNPTVAQHKAVLNYITNKQYSNCLFEIEMNDSSFCGPMCDVHGNISEFTALPNMPAGYPRATTLTTPTNNTHVFSVTLNVQVTIIGGNMGNFKFPNMYIKKLILF